MCIACATTGLLIAGAGLAVAQVSKFMVSRNKNQQCSINTLDERTELKPETVQKTNSVCNTK